MKGSELNAIINWYGFSQRAMADLLGITPQNFNSYLRAEDVRSSLVERVARALGLPMGVLYGEHAESGTPGQMAARAEAHSNAISGNGNHLNTSTNEDRLISLLEEKDKQIANYQAQISKLIELINK